MKLTALTIAATIFATSATADDYSKCMNEAKEATSERRASDQQDTLIDGAFDVVDYAIRGRDMTNLMEREARRKAREERMYMKAERRMIERCIDKERK